MWTRRAVVTRTMALAACPLAATKSRVPPPPRTANIRWPGPNDELHGYMAIPAKAKGRQPAVLIVHDAGGANAFTRSLTDRVALAGLLACAPTYLSSLADADATIRWLASNRYATGKVAAIGLGWGGELLQRVAEPEHPMLVAAVTFGTPSASQFAIPRLALDSIGQLAAAGDATYESAWGRTLAFLKEHLA